MYEHFLTNTLISSEDLFGSTNVWFLSDFVEIRRNTEKFKNNYSQLWY